MFVFVCVGVCSLSNCLSLCRCSGSVAPGVSVCDGVLVRVGDCVIDFVTVGVCVSVGVLLCVGV